MSNVGLHPGLGLSYSPYLTENTFQRSEKLLHVKRYKWGEVVISTHNRHRPNKDESIQKPPTQTGQRIVEGLSERGKTKLRRAATLYDNMQGEHGSKNMITLSYGGSNLSDHETAKKDLDRFLKSMSRYVKKTNRVGEEVHYVWVAEIQTKRKARTGEDAIHFHIMTIHYIPKELINKWWNNAVNKPRMKQGLPTQTLYPHVVSCFHAGRYMAKYLSKEGHKIKGNGYNMSQATSRGVKPEHDVYCVAENDIESFYKEAEKLNTTQTQYKVEDQEGTNRLLWMPSTKGYLFDELIASIENKCTLNEERKTQLYERNNVHPQRRIESRVSTPNRSPGRSCIKANEREGTTSKHESQSFCE